MFLKANRDEADHRNWRWVDCHFSAFYKGATVNSPNGAFADVKVRGIGGQAIGVENCGPAAQPGLRRANHLRLVRGALIPVVTPA